MEKTQKQGRGCLFYGCLTGILIFIGVLVGIFLGTRQAVKYAVNTYTSPTPVQVPRVELSPGDQERIARDLEQRAAAAVRNAQPSPIALSEQEINILIAQSPDLRPYQNQIYLKPVGTQLQAHVSLPLDQFALWKQFLRRLRAQELSGRYFNGVAIVHPSVTNGALALTITDLLVNGKSMPGEFTGRLKDLDLAKKSGESGQALGLLKEIEKVEVRDDKVFVQPRANRSE